MKKLLVILFVLGFVCISFAADVEHKRQTILLDGVIATGNQESDTILVKDGRNLPKQLFISCLGTGVTIRFQLQIGDVISGDRTWATTYDFTLTESSGTWTLTPVGGTAVTVPMPFILTSPNGFKMFRTQYNIGGGGAGAQIEKLVLTTIQ